jgi:glycosyltransferase involved in cell wall biosynthesis
MPLGMTARRLRFNVELAIHARSAGVAGRPDLTVGVDMDGFLLHPWHTGPYLVAIKGVLAEELTFERGLVRRLLALQAWCEARNVRRSSLVTTTSRYAADQIGRHYVVTGRRLRIVPELIDLAAWRNAIANAPDADPGAPPRILSVAHMYPRKSLDVLLRAVALLPERWNKVELRLIGIGPEQARWQSLALMLGLGDRAHFLGHVPREQLAAEYRRCALFCLPSRQEGFGIVFLEAMAAGKAVVAAAASAVPEVVIDGVSGMLVPPGDVAALAQALTKLLDDPDHRARLGAGGRELVEQYDAPRVAARFLRVAEETIATSRR